MLIVILIFKPTGLLGEAVDGAGLSDDRRAHDRPRPRPAAGRVSGAVGCASSHVRADPRWTQTRSRILFAVFVAFLVLYPLIDRRSGSDGWAA